MLWSKGQEEERRRKKKKKKEEKMKRLFDERFNIVDILCVFILACILHVTAALTRRKERRRRIRNDSSS